MGMQASQWTKYADADLALAVADGSDGALAEIFRRYSSQVLGLARRVLRDPSIAEEVVQDVFLKFWREPERFDSSRGNLRSFLLAMTHHRSVDLIRSESARRIREEKDARLAIESGPDIEEEVWQMAQSQKVQFALAGLPEGERSVIELAYYGGLTYREVASRLGLPEGTVKSRIRAGLKRLAVMLEDKLPQGALEAI